MQVLAAAGIASRRKCVQMIEAGRVKVNNDIIKRPPHRVVLGKDQIRVDDVGIQTVQRKYYLMVHKPKGYACSTAPGADVAAKPVLELLEPFLKKWREERPVGTKEPRFFPVGRLDVNTTGLLLVTNDGHWAQRVMHPSSRAHPSQNSPRSRLLCEEGASLVPT